MPLDAVTVYPAALPAREGLSYLPAYSVMIYRNTNRAAADYSSAESRGQRVSYVRAHSSRSGRQGRDRVLRHSGRSRKHSGAVCLNGDPRGIVRPQR
jgi:hypothetical protein